MEHLADELQCNEQLSNEHFQEDTDFMMMIVEDIPRRRHRVINYQYRQTWRGPRLRVQRPNNVYRKHRPMMVEDELKP